MPSLRLRDASYSCKDLKVFFLVIHYLRLESVVPCAFPRLAVDALVTVGHRLPLFANLEGIAVHGRVQLVIAEKFAVVRLPLRRDDDLLDGVRVCLELPEFFLGHLAELL